jgi:hypothetical protein
MKNSRQSNFLSKNISGRRNSQERDIYLIATIWVAISMMSAATNMMLRRLSASTSSISGPSGFLHFISTLHEKSFLITPHLTFLFGKTLPQKLPEIPTFCFQFCPHVAQRYFQYCTLKKCRFIPDSKKKKSFPLIFQVIRIMYFKFDMFLVKIFDTFLVYI